MTARLERLVNLLAALIDTERPLSRSELFERIPGYPPDEASARRGFERDKEALRNMGVPIVTLPIDANYPEHGEGYRVLPEEYYLPDPGFTRDEMSALALAASAVKLKSQSASAALWKLGGDPRQVTSLEDVEIPESDELATVFAARRERRSISFSYKGQQRTLDPYRLTFRNGRWYVNGFDHGHEDVRTYRFDRMEGKLSVGEKNGFPVPQSADQPWLPPWRMGDEEPVVAQLLVDKSQSEMAIAQAGVDSVVERREDGSVVLELTVTNRNALQSFVLGFLDHAELLSPAELRADLVSYLESLAVNG